MTDSRDIRLAAHRRRTLAAMAHLNIRLEAQRIAEEQGIPHNEAISQVFTTPELLRKCCDVLGRPVPDMPRSDVDAQNLALSDEAAVQRMRLYGDLN